MPSVIGPADVLRAWRALEATTDDERREIARLLGFDLRDLDTPGASPPIRPTTLPHRLGGGRAGTFISDEAMLPPTQGDPISLIPFPPVRDERPPLPKALERPQAGRKAARAPEPLFAPPWARAIAATLSERIAAAGPLDVDRAIDAIVRKRALRVLPRRDRMVSASAVSIVIDTRGALAWFRKDADGLADRINSVTRAHVALIASDGAPRLAAETELAGQSEDLDRPTSVRVGHGGRVVGVSDLGLGSSWDRGDAVRLESWIAFAAAIRGREASLVLVVPVPRARVPLRLARLAACVYWDRTTRPGLVYQLVKGLG